MGFLVSISTVRINSKSFPWNVHSIQETSPDFLRRPMPVDNTTDNADVTYHRQPITIDYWVTWYLGLVECIILLSSSYCYAIYNGRLIEYCFPDSAGNMRIKVRRILFLIAGGMGGLAISTNSQLLLPASSAAPSLHLCSCDSIWCFLVIYEIWGERFWFSTLLI